MPKKKTEHLAWELRLIAPPGTIFSTSEDEEPSFIPQEELGLDTQWPDLWIGVPDQPDFEGRKAKAHAWLDKHAPATGLYRLRRLVGEQLMSVQMVLSIQRLPMTKIDIKLRGANEAKEDVAKAAKSLERLIAVGSTRVADGKLFVCVEVDEEADAFAWRDADYLDGDNELTPVQRKRVADRLAELRDKGEIGPRDPEVAKAIESIDPDALAEPPLRAVPPDGEHEAPEKKPTTASEALRRNHEAAASAGELDLAAAPPEKPKNGDAGLTARAVWVASPLRKCRSLQECCFCDGSITSGQHYYDRGYGKRAHQECVEEMVDF